MQTDSNTNIAAKLQLLHCARNAALARVVTWQRRDVLQRIGSDDVGLIPVYSN